MVKLVVSPASAFIDEIQNVCVHSVEQNLKITIRALVNERGRKFESYAHFSSAPGNELVQLDKHPSLGGSYTGVMPMGLFTHMQPSPGQRVGIRLVKKDVTTPLNYELTVYAGFLSIADFYSKTTSLTILAKTIAVRWYMAKNSERIEIQSGNIRGTMFKPKGIGPFPGIIDMFGSAGGIMEFRAALFASYGFACLSLTFFDYQDLPEKLPSVDMVYFEEAVDWLINQAYVLSDGVGVISVSTGAQTALMMTTISGPKIKACVSINGCPFHTPYGPSRLYKGKEEESLEMTMENIIVKDNVLHMENVFLGESADEENRRKPLIKLEEAEANILFIVSEDDHNWPSAKFTSIICEHLRNHGKDNWSLLSYPGAGHLLEPPYTPLCTLCYQQNIGYCSFYGGQKDEHAAAQEDSWRNILSFFKKHLDKNDVIRRSTFQNTIEVQSRL